jgi:6-phosphofructokinase 1
LLAEGKSSRVVGINGGKIVDMDIDKALAVPRKFNEQLYTIANVLSY